MKNVGTAEAYARNCKREVVVDGFDMHFLYRISTTNANEDNFRLRIVLGASLGVFWMVGVEQSLLVEFQTLLPRNLTDVKERRRSTRMLDDIKVIAGDCFVACENEHSRNVHMTFPNRNL